MFSSTSTLSAALSSSSLSSPPSIFLSRSLEPSIPEGYIAPLASAVKIYANLLLIHWNDCVLFDCDKRHTPEAFDIRNWSITKLQLVCTNFCNFVRRSRERGLLSHTDLVYTNLVNIVYCIAQAALQLSHALHDGHHNEAFKKLLYLDRYIETWENGGLGLEDAYFGTLPCSE